MKKLIKNIMCFFNVHDWYKKDSKNGVFCKEQCWNCGEYNPKN